MLLWGPDVFMMMTSDMEGSCCPCWEERVSRRTDAKEIDVQRWGVTK